MNHAAISDYVVMVISMMTVLAMRLSMMTVLVMYNYIYCCHD